MALHVPANATVYDLPPAASAQFRLSKTPKDPLFSGKPRLEDISQGSIADCFFLSSLMAILSRNNGPQFIENMVVEHEGQVTVRLYRAPGVPIYIRTPKCRVQQQASGDNVSIRTCCWVDVIEACASIFNMKARDGAPDILVNLQQPSPENLHEGVASKALTVLLGRDANSSEVKDTRELKLNKSDGYGAITVMLDASQAPDRDYRQQVIDENFGNLAASWNSWAEKNKGAFDKFLIDTDKRPPADGTLRPRTIKLALVDNFLQRVVPQQFREGLRQYLLTERVVAGSRMEAVYAGFEVEYYDHLEGLCRQGWPIVATSRTVVGRSEGRALCGEDMCKGLLGGHAYCLESVYIDDHKRRWVLISNPWGKYVRSYQITTGKPYHADNIYGAPVGQFRITLHDLVKRFESYAWSETTFS